MTQKYAKELFSVPLGKVIVFNDNPIKIIGKMREKYKHADGVAEAYILALEGKREVGIELRDGQWYAWTSFCVSSMPYSRTEIEKLMAPLSDVETGIIKRMEFEG